MKGGKNKPEMPGNNHWEKENTGVEQDLYGRTGRRAACPLLEAQVSLRSQSIREMPKNISRQIRVVK